MKYLLCVCLILWTSIAMAQRIEVSDYKALHSNVIHRSRRPIHRQYPIPRNRVIIPRTQDEELYYILNGFNTIYYKLDKSYQQYNGYRYGVYYADYLKDFNANLDFPWSGTIGFNHAISEGNTAYSSVNFLTLPRRTNGYGVKPIVVLRENPYKWIFPEETIVGELLYVKRHGIRHCFEVRLRKKQNNTWEPSIYRPTKNRKHLMRQIGSWYPYHEKYLHMRNPERN